MKEEVTYVCGHTGTLQIYGPANNRERTLKFKETQLCPACYEEAKNAEYFEIREKYYFADLTGSLKQIEWAEKIRRDWALRFYIDFNDKGFEMDEVAANGVYAWIAGTVFQARTWIDNRGRLWDFTVNEAQNYKGYLLKVARKSGLESEDESLPDMIGTETEVEEAEKIRLSFLDRYSCNLSHPLNKEACQYALWHHREAKEWLANKDDIKKWHLSCQIEYWYNLTRIAQELRRNEIVLNERTNIKR